MAKPRVTHRTDTRGTVNADFKGAYELHALAAAHKAGIPGDLLHPAGWNGDENDVRGYFAELIYRIGEIPFTAPDAIEQLSEAIKQMRLVCQNLGVDHEAAIPYEMAKFKRQLHEGRQRHAALARGDCEFPPASEAEAPWTPQW
jgi:hypothetical protein